MIEKPIAFDESDLDLIKMEYEKDDFCSLSWSAEHLKVIKQKIKDYYLSKGVQNNTCPYCKRDLNTQHGRCWDIEHIIPRSHAKYFMFEPYNLCLSCIDCNQAKSNKDITVGMLLDSKARVHYPLESAKYKFIHPHFDNYEEHMIIIEEGLLYWAKTPKGEQTKTICSLDRFQKYVGITDHDSNARMIIALTNAALAETDFDTKKKLITDVASISLKCAVSIHQC
jgi:hypothetical protein